LDEAYLTEDFSKRIGQSLAVYCPECVFEMEDVMDNIRREDLPEHDHPAPQYIVDQIKRHEMYIDQLQGENARMFGQIEMSLKYIREAVDKQAQQTDHHDSRLDHIERKLDVYNEVKTRVDTLETTHKQLSGEYIPRQEFNGALSSIRDSIGILRWMFGGFVAGVFAFASYVIFGG
jgi:tetrahydromethanopterin S-methyltransferase subunit G